MRKHNLYHTLIFCLVASIIISCESENQPNGEVQDIKNTSENKDNHSIEVEIVEKDFEFMPPSPIQIASILKKANMNYEEGLTNKVSNSKLYSTKFKQTINFGVYACDLAYCVTNDKFAEASKYLKVSKEMASKIGMESIFLSDNLVERFEKNVGNQDSVMSILFDIQIMTDDYIQDNELTDLSVIYFTGAWVEGMNIGTHTILGNNDHKISVLLSEQMTIARSLIRGLRAVENQTDDLIDLTDHIEEVVDAYHNLWSVKQEGENIEYLDVELKHEEAISISEMILELREEITM
ncbi:MAG: hypothetical protein ISQ99_04945 [Flavobacteriales bacterium]|nr:hypothetical protein [Flavobacteriales bacterium]MBL6869397.1 hypothetical protein [Flavobacteriales bacterium]MDB0010825.1 hypothetical protein [Flavobacteriales bacterium]